MYTILKNGIAIVPKAYEVKLDNVLVAENDKVYYIVPLITLQEAVWERYNGFGHPLADLTKLQEDGHVKLWMVVEGQKVSGLFCALCKNKFNGYTGNCTIRKKDWADEACRPNFTEKPKAPVLQVREGVKVSPKYFNNHYQKYYHNRDLGDYTFTLDALEHALGAKQNA